MEPRTFIEAATALLPEALLLATLALLGSVVTFVLLLQGRRVPAVVGAFAAALVPSAATWIAVRALGSPDAAAGIVGARLASPVFALPAVGIALLFAAALAVLAPPRRWAATAVTALVVVLGVGALVAGGVVNEVWEYPLLRGLAYGGLGLVLALAAAAGGQPGAAEGAAIAGVGYAGLVGVGEASGRALTEAMLLLAARGVDPVNRAAFFEAAVREGLDPDVPYAWAMIAAAVLAGAIAVGSGALRVEGGRRIGILACLPLLAVGPIAYAMGDLTPAMLAAAVG